ncbi:MAG TPA: ribonuclease E inhibitor RraB [Steroidobacteraceae bacterium]|nr:ribonuclease E inhibitor RraB [Steroidobacteraceae bacterium]
MNWLILVLFLVALGLVVRIYMDVRKYKQPRVKDWDEQVIEQLRARGWDPFQPVAVDFFLAMPAEGDAQSARLALEAEGFTVEVRSAPENPYDQPFSLRATKAVRISLPGMREFRARFSALATEHGGHYDGWSA